MTSNKTVFILFFVLNRVRILSPQQLTFTQVFTFTLTEDSPFGFHSSKGAPRIPAIFRREGGREEGVKKWYVQGVDIRETFFEKHVTKVILVASPTPEEDS